MLLPIVMPTPPIHTGDTREPGDTRAAEYTQRLSKLGGVAWKRWLNVQAPYRWNLRRLRLGRTLDVGCGIGRNLMHLDGNGVGIDHNESSVALAIERGLSAFDPAGFRASTAAHKESFDTVLIAHVLEHMTPEEGIVLVRSHLEYLKRGGRVVLITPQDAGFRTDPTHVQFVDFEGLAATLAACDLQPVRHYSFPFPRAMGRRFPHNEFVAIGRKD